MTARIDSIRVKALPDESPDTSYLEQEGFEEHLEAYNNDEFAFIGIVAYAEVSYPMDDQGNRRCETFQSGGLWGIESDSGDYLNEVMAEELSDLRDHLKHFGVVASDGEWLGLTDGLKIEF